MCGIGGQLSRGNVVSAERLQRMAEAMRLRGPDDEGFFIAGDVGLAHTRLSIRDLSARGRCPMPNEDGTVQAVFNGEIYNWRELRTELEDLGHSFESSCDSEVISHGYEEWSEELFRRLRGMFAIGIWDARAQRLVLARDRLGEKPLFYSSQENSFVFASTIGAIIADGGDPRRINTDAIACYLAHSFIPATHTAFAGVEVFPPASYGIIDRTGALKVTRYWGFPDVAPRRVSIPTAEREVEALLSDCVKRCLDADVPVGVFLSGGVDSSVVAAVAARHQARLRSFSVGFDEPHHNELPYARRVAETLKTEHHEVVLRVGDVIELLPALVEAYDQPFGDASAVPTHAVSRLARPHVKVCLSGDGGDESFAGYWRAQALSYASRYAQVLPQSLRASLASGRFGQTGTLGRRVAALNQLSLGSRGAGYTNTQSWYGRMAEIVGPALRAALNHDCVNCRVGTASGFRNATTLQRALFDDFQVQLPDAYLRKVDVASMAASLEVRAPLLDVELLELAWTLPDRAKLHWGERKYLLKRIAARLVPRDVIYRKKMGFAMPLAQWFRGPLGDFLKEVLRSSVAVDEGWLNSNAASRELEQHRSGQKDNHTRLWLILWLELWLRNHYARIASSGELMCQN